MLLNAWLDSAPWLRRYGRGEAAGERFFTGASSLCRGEALVGPVESVGAMKTKGQLEAEISEAIIRFEKEYMGRGPEETKTYLIDDIVLVRLRGVLTPAEKQLAKSGDQVRGRELIKQVRIELLEKARTLLEKIVLDITGQAVKGLHTDISTVTGERIIVFVLDRALLFPKDKPEPSAD